MARIVLFCVEDVVEKQELEKLVSYLNNKQRHGSMEFVVHDNRVSMRGTMDADHSYSHAQYFAKMKEEDGTYKIGITHAPLEGACFNAQDITNPTNLVGIITTEDTERYKLESQSRYQYLAFLVLCVSLCLVAKRDFEAGHQRNRCLFDYCYDRNDLTESLKDPHFCLVCLDLIDNQNALEEAIKEDAEAILKFIAQKSKWRNMLSTLSMRYMSLLYGLILKDFVMWVLHQFDNKIALNGFEWWVIGMSGGIVAFFVFVRLFISKKQ